MKVRPQNVLSILFFIIFRGAQLFGKMPSRRIRSNFREIWKFRYMDFGIFNCSKIMEFDLKWVHTTRYELILRLDRALWLRIIFRPLLTPKRLIKIPKYVKAARSAALNFKYVYIERKREREIGAVISVFILCFKIQRTFHIVY